MFAGGWAKNYSYATEEQGYMPESRRCAAASPSWRRRPAGDAGPRRGAASRPAPSWPSPRLTAPRSPCHPGPPADTHVHQAHAATHPANTQLESYLPKYDNASDSLAVITTLYKRFTYLLIYIKCTIIELYIFHIYFNWLKR